MATGILFNHLMKKVTRKDVLFLLIGLLIAFILRYVYGIFGPVHPEDHHVEVIMNLIRNLEYGSFFRVPYVYGGESAISGGLFELFYHNILSLFSDFHIYQVYYISLLLHLICSLFIFLLALNLFKNKNIAYISFAISIFLPILIRFSATEIKFIMDSFTIILFINFFFYVFKDKNINKRNYLLLSLLFIANLVGRKEYMVLFPVAIIILITIFLMQRRKELKININSLLPFMVLIALTTSFYIMSYALVEGSSVIGNHYIEGRSWETESWLIRNFFLFHDGNSITFANFMKSFFTPWYFLIAFIFTPVILILSKKWTLLSALLIGFSFAIFLKDLELSNSIRKLLPLIFLSVPLIGYSFYTLLESLKINKKIITPIAIIIISFSIFQNLTFLEIETSRKIEQDFLLYHLENTIPEGSLILTIHEKKYEHSIFPQKENKYKYQQHGFEFYSYLLSKHEIDVMDIYREYDPEIIKNYEGVFYYRSLYSYHEEDLFLAQEKYLNNPEGKSGPEVTKNFENNHILVPIAEKNIWNYDFHNRTTDEITRGVNYSIKSKGGLEIGLYLVKDF